MAFVDWEIKDPISEAAGARARPVPVARVQTIGRRLAITGRTQLHEAAAEALDLAFWDPQIDLKWEQAPGGTRDDDPRPTAP